jgi:vancomycin resistance protein YoaR
MQRPRLIDVPQWRIGLRRLRRGQRTVQRLLAWVTASEFQAPHYVSTSPAFLVGEVRVPLVRSGAHPLLERGKRQNVMLAATALDLVQTGPHLPLSFWRTVGPLTKQRGFVAGMELQGGCAVPAIGGGVCALSNALYQLAAELGWKILERHAHTAAVGSVTQLDATVAFPHVDLRVQPDRNVVIRASVRGDVLVLSAWSAEQASGFNSRRIQIRQRTTNVEGQAETFRVVTERSISREATNAKADVHTELLSDEIRKQLPTTQPTCISCDETNCETGNRLLHAAGVARDAQ